MKMRLIRKTNSRAVYKLKDFRKINNKFFREIPWPDNLRGMIFSFEKKIKDEQKVIKAISSKYWVSVGYSVESRKLVNCGNMLPNHIRPSKPTNTELHKLFCKTQSMFYKTWRNNLGPAYLKEVRMVADNMLNSAKVTCLKKNGKAVGLLIVVKWKNHMDIPVNWVVWVWIDRNLPVEERTAVRDYFTGWMKKHIRGCIQCVINSFNIKSHRFFKKMGFFPECVHYIRTK
ncbi:MAG TPA: hypothetical protein DCL44_10575 [Elusimicrobia bacterium]|nr:hypothetical protein [Elusimicrobiota bacterium]